MKCFNCGKVVKDNLKFCTNCGADLNKIKEDEVEIINNDEEEGKDVANDKTAIIAICLTLILGIFIVIVGISSTNRYKCIEDCDIVEPVEVVEANEVEFNSDSNFKLLGKKYKFKDTLNSFLEDGFKLEETIEHSNSEEEILLSKNNQELYLHVVNNSNLSLSREDYSVKELNFTFYDSTRKRNENILELPDEVTLFDSYDSVIEKYGDYDYRNDNCYVYKYSNSDGHIELCFNNKLLNGIKIVNEVR